MLPDHDGGWISARHSTACSYLGGDRFLVLMGGFGAGARPLNGKGLACVQLHIARSAGAVDAITSVYDKGASNP